MIEPARPKMDIHQGIDTFAVFIQANAEFFGVAIRNKTRLIEWYKLTKEESIKAITAVYNEDVENITTMYDKLLHNAEIELVELQSHIDFLGIRIPEEQTVDGENAR
jgi:hypothetical protein